ncbi:MAG: NnrS family protein [Gammaproteobacteria bacterium]|nr:NnrS family protein [Gammaproteobacteria bacterium]
MLKNTPLFALGFRPFFLGALLFSLVAMALWAGIYFFGVNLRTGLGSPMQWHAHEMIFGYCGAVIAGFLLTSVRNWSGRPTLTGLPLMLLFLSWLLARISFFLPVGSLWLAAVFTALFYLGLMVGIGRPLIQARQWRNMGVLAKLGLIVASDLCFFLGVAGLIGDGLRIGLYSGFYLVVSLVLMMCRRLIPFFTEGGVGAPVVLKNSTALDRSLLLLFLPFWLVETFWPAHLVGTVLAVALALLHGVRWSGWLTPGIWRRPLLWVLYLAYGSLILGFVLRGMSGFLPLSPRLPLHAFAVGGVGLVTAGMLARVTLGHTGRNIHAPPALLAWGFVCLLLAGLSRVLLPLVDLTHYGLWVGLSQLFWVVGFGLLSIILVPMLVAPRIDGQPG